MAASLAGLINIGPRTFLYTPPKPRSGQLIILCTWLGAARKHVAKYIDIYQSIAPNARVLLIESSVGIITSAFIGRQIVVEFAPAATVVMNTIAECKHRSPSGSETIANRSLDDEKTSPQNRRLTRSSSHTEAQILLHIFSNGGMNSAAHLLRVLRSPMNEPLALTGIIFDSCPGKGTSYWQTFDAIVLSFPQNFVWRLLGALAIHCFLIFVVVYITCGNENPVTLWRRTPFENSTPACGACYLFSKEDRMIGWRDIEQHAEEARRRGWRVKEVLFEGSGHCAHLAMDRGRYVEAVNSIWESNGGSGRILAV